MIKNSFLPFMRRGGLLRILKFSKAQTHIFSIPQDSADCATAVLFQGVANIT